MVIKHHIMGGMSWWRGEEAKRRGGKDTTTYRAWTCSYLWAPFMRAGLVRTMRCMGLNDKGRQAVSATGAGMRV